MFFLGPRQQPPTYLDISIVKSVEDLLFQRRVLRVSVQPNSNGFVAFEVAEEAEEFRERIILESGYEPITPDEWCATTSCMIAFSESTS